MQRALLFVTYITDLSVNVDGLKNLFTQRMIHIWKVLPKEVTEVGTITTLKRHLDRYIDSKGLEVYGLDAGKWDLVRQLHQHG